MSVRLNKFSARLKVENEYSDPKKFACPMGVAWVGILPRQGVWVVCPAKAIDFWGDIFWFKF